MRELFAWIWACVDSVGCSFEAWQDEQFVSMNAEPKLSYVRLESQVRLALVIPVDEGDVQPASIAAHRSSFVMLRGSSSNVIARWPKQSEMSAYDDHPMTSM